jgi:4-hydroxy-tetrahydrodipicolinate synthase
MRIMAERSIFGLSAALVTPFAADGTVDLARLAKHARHVLAEGCDTVTLFGTTGEGYGLSLGERAAMIGALAGSGIEPLEHLYAGVSAAPIDDAVEQARLALSSGARGLLFAPPFYLKGVDDEGLYAWFARAFEKIGAMVRGVILYHIPGQTAVPLSVDLVGRLKRAFPGVVTGVKDSSGQWEDTQAFLKAHGELSILVGDERQLARAIRAGGEGSICGLANMTPGLLRKLIYSGEDSRTVVDLVDMISSYPVLPAVKALTGHVHRDAGFGAMRPPVSDLDAGQKAKLAAAFDAILAEA